MSKGWQPALNQPALWLPPLSTQRAAQRAGQTPGQTDAGPTPMLSQTGPLSRSLSSYNPIQAPGQASA